MDLIISLTFGIFLAVSILILFYEPPSLLEKRFKKASAKKESG